MNESAKDPRVLVLAQEVKFAQALASNDRFLRERSLRRLEKWLLKQSASSHEFTEEGLMILLRGIFYCIWMSDKPLIQEETVDNVCRLVHCFHKFDDFLKFFTCFFTSLSQNWYGLDQNRLDKYLMLVRRFVRSSFAVLELNGWERPKVLSFSQELEKILVISPVGIVLHIADMYLEEAAKVSKGALSSDTVLHLVEPFGKFIGQSSDPRIISSIFQNVFYYLMKQSEEGLKHDLKFNAWKQAGFPGGTIDVMEEVLRDDSDAVDELMEDESELDPRAGSVHVYLPPLSFDASKIALFLQKERSSADITTRGRKALKKLADKFKLFASGNYPLGVKQVELPSDDDEELLIENAVERLFEAEANDYQEVVKEKKVKTGKKKKSKKPVWRVSNQSTSTEEGLKRKNTYKRQSSWEVSPMEDQLPQVSPQVNGKVQPDLRKSKPNKIQNNGWGGSLDWGEIKNAATRIVTPAKKSRKSHPTKRRQSETNSFLTPKNTSKLQAGTPGSSKKVEFVLNRNTAQEETEYKQTLKKRPSIPFDANKKPLQGVLKPSPVVSPINPFYRHLIKSYPTDNL